MVLTRKGLTRNTWKRQVDFNTLRSPVGLISLEPSKLQFMSSVTPRVTTPSLVPVCQLPSAFKFTTRESRTPRTPVVIFYTSVSSLGWCWQTYARALGGLRRRAGPPGSRQSELQGSPEGRAG